MVNHHVIKAYDEACALLAGDALAIYPFEVIAKNESVSAEGKVKVIADLSNAVGVDGMIGGQVIDIEHEGKAVDEELLRKLCGCKTGALIRTASRIGCICAEADEKQILLLLPMLKKLVLHFK